MTVDVLALGRSNVLRAAAWAVGAATVCTIVGFLVAARPWFATGATVGGALLLLLLVRPRVVVGLMLAVGAVDLSFVTGGSRALLPGLGGLDMNGIRLVGLVAGLTALALVDRRFWRHAFRPEARWYLLFLVYAAATLFVSSARLDGARLLFKLAFPLVIFVAVLGTAGTRRELERYADWVLLGAAGLLLVANPIYVITGGYEVSFGGQLRVQGLGMHENPFSFYLTIMLLLAFARYAVRGQVRYLALCGVVGGWLVLTYTRISLAASMAGLLGLALYAAVVRRNYRVIGAGLLIGAVVAVPFTPVALERTFGRVLSAGELLALVQHPVDLYRQMNWQGRDRFWPVIVGAFLSNPFTGAGLGSTGQILQSSFQSTQVVHNEYLRLLAETGVLGGVLFAVAIGRWCVAVVSAGRIDEPLVREFALPAFAGIIAWSIIAVTDNAFDYYAQFTQYVGFLCAGALAAVEVTAGRRDEAGGDEAAGRGAGGVAPDAGASAGTGAAVAAGAGATGRPPPIDEGWRGR